MATSIPAQYPGLDREHLRFLSERFDQAQKGFTQHNAFAAEIAKRFKDDTCLLLKTLKPILRIIMQQFKINPPVERAMKFVVKIVTNRENGIKWSETMTYTLMRWLLEFWNAKDRAVRFRMCEILGNILNELDENIEIDEDLWIDMEEKLLNRIKDKFPRVRRSACIALNRLQMPDDENCKVVKNLSYTMDHDSHKDCRREALIRLDLNKNTLMKILRRIRDIHEDVRASAFKRLQQVDVTALTIYDRVVILKTGLKDRVEKVKTACSNMLVSRWFAKKHFDIIKFLRLIDPENYEQENETILKHMLSRNVKMNNEYPPFSADQLSSEHVFYWRVLADHYAEEDNLDGLDSIMPDIKDFCKILDAHKENEFLAWQLLKMAVHLDFQDEYGRGEIIRLSQELMRSPNVSHELIPYVTRVLRKVMEEDGFIQIACEIVNEIRDPLDEEEPEDEEERLKMEKQLEDKHDEREQLKVEKLQSVRCEDFETAGICKQQIDRLTYEMDLLEEQLNAREKRDQRTWKRVLTIVGDLLEFTKCSIDHPFLQPLLNNTLVPAVSHEDPFIREPGLLAFGLYCLLDKNAARKNMILFLKVLQQDQLALQYLSLKILFDFFMVFDMFDKPKDNPEGDDGAQEDMSRRVITVLEAMKTFLNSEDHDMLACAVEL